MKERRYIVKTKETSAVIIDSYFPDAIHVSQNWDYNSPCIIEFVVLPHNSDEKTDRIMEMELKALNMNENNKYSIVDVANAIFNFTEAKIQLRNIFPRIQEIRIL